jgi:hypothetical protein
VERYTPKEALTYLRTRVGPGDPAGARRLAEALDRLPLALSIAAACLVGPPRPGYDAYLVRLRDTPVDRLLARPSGEPYPNGVAQSVLLTVARISPDARKLLGELAVMCVSGLRMDLLEPGETLTELGTASLVTFSRDGSTVILHRLVQRVIRDRAQQDGTLLSLVEGAAQRLHPIKEVADEDTWRMLPLILAAAEHCAALWERVEPLLDTGAGAVASAVLDVRFAVGCHLIYLNDGNRAVPVCEAVVEGRARVLGDDHPDTLTARHALAHAYEYAERAQDAIELLQRVLADRKRVLGADHPDTLTTRARLAAARTETGPATQVLALFEEVTADQERVLGADHPDTLGTRFNQAYAHVVAQRAERAVELFEQVAADRARVLGPLHPDTLVTLGRLAWARTAAGRADDAVKLYEQVVADQERALGTDHPDTLITRYGLASAYEAAGRIADAASGYQSVAGRFEAVLGDEHGLTRTSKDSARRALETP